MKPLTMTNETVALNYALKDLINYINQTLAKDYRGMHESIDKLYCSNLKLIRASLQTQVVEE